MTIHPAIIPSLLELIKDRLGLHFEPDNFPAVEKALAEVSTTLGYSSGQALAEYLLSPAPAHGVLRSFAEYLTVGETYFFREPGTFDVFRKKVSRLISERRKQERKLRIWSAGCSTGEEAYTIAMILANLLPDIREWDISLLATDINERSLDRAREGTYGAWSFRGAPKEIQTKFFLAAQDGKHHIINKVKELVRFQPLNLVEDAYPSPLTRTNYLDYIFCRNVLMYFDEAGRSAVLKKFFHCLAPGGCLFIGMTELAQQTHKDFAKHIEDEVHYFRKELFPTPEPRSRNAGFVSPNDLPGNTKPPLSGNSIAGTEIPVEAGGAFAAVERTHGNRDLRALFENRQYTQITELYDSRVVDSAIDSTVTDAEYDIIIKSFIHQGNRKRGLQICDLALTTRRTCTPLYLNRGAILADAENYRDAIAALKKCLYLDPSFLAAYYLLLGVYRSLRNTREIKRIETILRRLIENRRDDDPVQWLEDVSIGEIRALISSPARAGAVI